jgi:Zn finger protein HypA/HybF involved in hydrogenase expression
MSVFSPDTDLHDITERLLKVALNTITLTLPDYGLEMLTTPMVVPCALCKEKVANAKFIPCGHKLVCKGCSVSLDVCPKCKSRVQAKVDNGKSIFMNNLKLRYNQRPMIGLFFVELYTM